MRELISAMLARQEGRYKVVAEKGDAMTAIDACKELAPDVLILDINLPDLSALAVADIVRNRAHRSCGDHAVWRICGAVLSLPGISRNTSNVATRYPTSKGRKLFEPFHRCLRRYIRGLMLLLLLLPFSAG